ncbi:MAG: cobalamin B12-binding domain-containing protein [Bacillota bacterium]
MLKPLSQAIADLELDKATSLVDKYVKEGFNTVDIIESCRVGVELVGKRYQAGEYYLADLVMSEAIFKELMAIIEPHLIKSDTPEQHSSGPHVLIGTIQGDIHDLGKSIVIYLLRSSGFIVRDLGVDVSIDNFVKEAKASKASIIGICFLLTNCVSTVKELIDTLEQEGIRNKAAIVIGGYAADEATRNYVGADYSATTTANVIPLFESIVKLNNHDEDR